MAAMKTVIKIQRGQLLSLLRDGGVFAGLRNTMSCLKNVRITTRGGRIRIESSDLDNHASVYGMCECATDISFCINSKEIASLVSLISDDEIKMQYDDEKNKLCIKHAHGKASLPTEPAADFPAMKTVQDGNSVVVSGTMLAEWLMVASGFVQSNLKGAVLENVNLSADEKHICVCGGSHHLVYLAHTDNVSGVPPFNICIPSSSAVVLSKLCAIHDEVTLTYSSNALYIETEDCKMRTLLVDAKYPNVNVFFNKVGTNAVCVEKDLLLKSLKRISSQCVKESNSVAVISQGGQLLLNYADMVGYDKSVEEQIPCGGISFGEVHVNLGYMLKAVNAYSGKMVYIYHDDSNYSPLILVDEDESGKEYYMVAPIA